MDSFFQKKVCVEEIEDQEKSNKEEVQFQALCEAPSRGYEKGIEKGESCSANLMIPSL